MKVAVLGCSFTYGMKYIENWHNWVEEFSIIRPDLHIDNYSNSGSSLRYSVELIDALVNDYDKIILQITNPGRFTYKIKKWGHPSEMLVNRNNHRWISTDKADQHYRFVNPWVADVKSRNADDDNVFAAEYYRRIDLSEIVIEHNSLISYVKKKTNFIYSQYSDYINFKYDDDIPIVEHQLDPELLKSFMGDKSGHFSVAGNKWVAQWINSNIDF